MGKALVPVASMEDLMQAVSRGAEPRGLYAGIEMIKDCMAYDKRYSCQSLSLSLSLSLPPLPPLPPLPLSLPLSRGCSLSLSKRSWAAAWIRRSPATENER